MDPTRELERRLRNAHRAAAVLVGIASALLVALVLDPSSGAKRAERDDDAVRLEAIRLAGREGFGVWDSHPDPDVGRVMQPLLEGRHFLGKEVRSNAFGMRERPYELFAPSDPSAPLRIVLLGDSLVFGQGAEAHERIGPRLERFLAERVDAGGREIEVLHLGASSWNIRAECAYLRRQLDLLRPALVVQVVVGNDLDDSFGVRGSGLMANFSPQVPDHVTGLVTEDAPKRMQAGDGNNLLLWGADWESRHRYADAAARIERLAAAVEDRGGRYLLLATWYRNAPMVRSSLAHGLREDQIAYISDAFALDPAIRVSATDYHWNAEGARRLALLLYGLAAERELLPGVAVPFWDAAARKVEEIHGAGLADALDREGMERERRQAPPLSALDFTDLSPEVARQVNGGLSLNGGIAPYASFLLAVEDGHGAVRVRGRHLPRGELRGAAIHVFLDEHRVGTLVAQPDAPVDRTFPLPAELSGARCVSVRFVAEDFVYAGGRLEAFVSFSLQHLSSVPE